MKMKQTILCTLILTLSVLVSPSLAQQEWSFETFLAENQNDTFLLRKSFTADDPVHSVTGSGVVSEGGVVFRSSIAAFKDQYGRTWGVNVTNLDLRAFGLGKITFRSDVTCLEVVGNSGWIGAVATHSTNPNIVPVGSTSITLVRDLGGNGTDVMHGEPSEFFPPGTTCFNKPALPESVVQEGNFTVR